ncbi:MAG: ABC transporter permease [Candidatus Hodarchaeales archaeon]
MNRIGALVRKEFDFMSKDLVSIGVLFLLPVVIIWIAAVADVGDLFTSDPQPIWIIDNDRSELSKRLVETFHNQSDKFIVTDSYTNNLTEDKALELLPSENLTAVIIIPNGFEDDLSQNGSTNIKIILDGLDSASASTAEGQINGVLVQFQFTELESLTLEAELFYFPVFVPEPSDILQAAAPGILSMSLFASINLICTQAIVGDIPLKRILVAPTRRWEVILSKTIAYSALAFFQSLFSLFLVEFLFEASFIGVFLDIFLAVFTIEFSGVCLGILFSTISQSRLQAAQLFLFYFILALMIQMKIRFSFLLPLLPIEQGMDLIISIAYRGQSIFQNIDKMFNIFFVSFVCLGLSLYWFQYKRREL